MKRLKNREGFTLVELIIVIAILAVLASIAVPNLLGSVEKSRQAKDEANAKIIADVITMWLAENDSSEVLTNYGIGNVVGGELRPYLDKNLSPLPVPVSKKYRGLGIFYVSHDGNGNITVNTTRNNNIILYPEVQVTTE